MEVLKGNLDVGEQRIPCLNKVSVAGILVNKALITPPEVHLGIVDAVTFRMRRPAGEGHDPDGSAGESDVNYVSAFGQFLKSRDCSGCCRFSQSISIWIALNQILSHRQTLLEGLDDLAEQIIWI